MIFATDVNQSKTNFSWSCCKAKTISVTLLSLYHCKAALK